jgi:hypothetical protein
MRAHVDFEAGAEDRYLSLRGSGVLARARRFDDRVRAAEWATAEIYWRSSDGSATRAARQLYRLDREIRRATAIVHATRFRGLPPPTPLRDGRLEIQRASAGSLDLVLSAIGIVSIVLLSQPVQLLMTTRALVGDGIRVVAWLGHMGSPPKEPDLFIELPSGGRIVGRNRIEIRGYRPDGSSDVIIAE